MCIPFITALIALFLCFEKEVGLVWGIVLVLAGAVYQALTEKGYNPINQLVGYIISEDPTYITNHNGARSLIRKVDRDELLALLLRSYLKSNF
ncbi:MAG: IreB family regulatory phosphoprotein [Clostridia bacterium]|nr:IreB family regulatory phosphoprotein [Clostridia bacterium]